MVQTNDFRLTIMGREIPHNFHAIVHTVGQDIQTGHSVPLLLDEDFYIKFGKLPTGRHHELEIKTPVWDSPYFEQGVIHVRTSKLNGRRFICYPLPIPSLSKAHDIFMIWCVGTTFTMITGRDFQEVLKMGGEIEFIRTMQKRFGIYL